MLRFVEDYVGPVFNRPEQRPVENRPHVLASPRSASVLVWLLLGMTVIIGIVALGLDGGRMMDERRRAQDAADAAALAAATSLYKNYWQNHGQDPSGAAPTAALASAAANGFDNAAIHNS